MYSFRLAYFEADQDWGRKVVSISKGKAPALQEFDRKSCETVDRGTVNIFKLDGTQDFVGSMAILDYGFTSSSASRVLGSPGIELNQVCGLFHMGINNNMCLTISKKGLLLRAKALIASTDRSHNQPGEDSFGELHEYSVSDLLDASGVVAYEICRLVLFQVDIWELQDCA